MPAYTNTISEFLSAYTWALTGTHIYGFLAPHIDELLVLQLDTRIYAI